MFQNLERVEFVRELIPTLDEFWLNLEWGKQLEFSQCKADNVHEARSFEE